LTSDFVLMTSKVGYVEVFPSLLLGPRP